MSLEAIDLRGVTRSRFPNDALACPPGVCAARADLAVPVYALAADVLRDRLRRIALAEPRCRQVGEAPALDQEIFEQRTRFLGLPDVIRVQLVGIDGEISAILYGRARRGLWDLGVNRRRLRRWLARLDRECAAEGTR